jgi:hypothetical protein
MGDVFLCREGACSAQSGSQSAGIVQRLDELMRRVRNDGHRVTYQDLLEVRHDGLSGAVTACGGHRTGQPAAGAPAGAGGPDSACGALGPRASAGAPTRNSHALNGIAATWEHDEGAYARCGDCGRYTLNPKALRVATHACECGSTTGWCGSFTKPGPDAKWSGGAPDGEPSQAANRPYACAYCDQREGWAHGEWCRGARTMVKRPAGVPGTSNDQPNGGA